MRRRSNHNRADQPDASSLPAAPEPDQETKLEQIKFSPAQLEPRTRNHLARLLERDSLEQNLSLYVQKSWPLIEPGKDLLWNWHIGLICEYLEAVAKSQIRRLIINIPPRYMKSTLVAVCWPTWIWTTQPSSRWIFGSYSADLSRQHSLARRHLIDSDWYQRCWRDRFQWSADQNVKQEYENNQRGRMFSTGVGGTLTGKGGDYLVVDDPHNPRQAASDLERKHALDWFDQTLSTRLDDKKNGRIVVIMQRLHEADLTGHLLAQGGWEHLKIAAMEPARKTYISPTTGSGTERQRDQLLWSEREGPEQIADMRQTLGSYGFSGQYQQEPAPADGAIFKRGWFRYYKVLPELDEMIQSWDCAFKDSDGSDYVVGQVWGRKGADKFLVHQVRDRLSFHATVAAIRSVTAAYPKAHAKLIEDKANGTAVIDSLKSEIAGIIPVEPQGGKRARAYAVQPEVEAGNIHLPDPGMASWVEEFLHEATLFDRGIHDDQVDAMTQALTRLNRHGGGIYNWLQNQTKSAPDLL